MKEGFRTTPGSCTTTLVGKDVSANGSNIIARTMDSSTMAPSRVITVPACNDEGTWVRIDPRSGMRVELPRKHFQYVAAPAPEYNDLQEGWLESGINSQNFAMSATETISTNEDVLAVDPFVEAGLTEANIATFVLPYASSAREGVKMLGEICSKYGASYSEAVSFCDEDEIWYMEMYSGHQWAARRMPSDKYAVIANDAILGFLDMEDTENWMCSPDIIEVTKKAGSYYELDGKFHLALSYGTPKRDYSQLRIWTGRRYFSAEDAGEYDVNTQYQIFDTPKEKIGVEDIFRLTRDRLQETPFDQSKGVGENRSIAIDRTSQSHVIEVKKGTTPIMWTCLGAPEFGVYVPVPGNLTHVPKTFSEAPVTYDSDYFTWLLRDIENVAALNREKYAAMVQEPFAKLEGKFLETVGKLGAATESEANTFFAGSEERAVEVAHKVRRELFTQFSIDSVEATEFMGRDIDTNKISNIKFDQQQANAKPTDEKAKSKGENAVKGDAKKAEPHVDLPLKKTMPVWGPILLFVGLAAAAASGAALAQAAVSSRQRIGIVDKQMRRRGWH